MICPICSNDLIITKDKIYSYYDFIECSNINDLFNKPHYQKYVVGDWDRFEHIEVMRIGSFIISNFKTKFNNGGPRVLSCTIQNINKSNAITIPKLIAPDIEEKLINKVKTLFMFS